MLKNGSIELLLTRIIQFCSNIHRLKFSDEFVSRFASISLLELLTIFYDWPSHCSFHVDLVIPNYCSCGDFKPSSFSNPSLFVERLCRNFDYEMELSIKKDEHFEGPFSCMSLSTKLLAWLIVDAKNKNSEWYSIVNTIAKKELGWKLNCFGEFLTDTISEGHVLSEEEILQMRENHDENLKKSCEVSHLNCVSFDPFHRQLNHYQILGWPFIGDSSTAVHSNYCIFFKKKIHNNESSKDATRN
jgi:hypothetical protein